MSEQLESEIKRASTTESELHVSVESLETITAELQKDANSERASRESKDEDLQTQIDAITAASDVVDVVATKADLDAYDTQTLTKDDIVKVLKDESQGSATTYYRISRKGGTFSLVGSIGPYYTQSETDGKLNTIAGSIPKKVSDLQDASSYATTSTTDALSKRIDDMGSISSLSLSTEELPDDQLALVLNLSSE